jgi:hypothetical protein
VLLLVVVVVSVVVRSLRAARVTVGVDSALTEALAVALAAGRRGSLLVNAGVEAIALEQKLLWGRVRGGTRREGKETATTLQSPTQ